MNFLNTILAPIEWVVSWILVAFHSLFTALGLASGSGGAWGLSIVGLVVVIRIALIPLFVKQIKAQRGLQILQPRIKELQQKYKNDRERQSQEMMKLYKETGTNPLASCLPILLQSPIFLALFRVLQGIAQGKPLGVLTPALVESARNSKIFGVPIYATFTKAADYPGVSPTNVRIVTLILIALMTLTTFTTQRQLMVKNMTSDNPMAQQQKILLYVFPLMFAVFGINFPVGVLIYWLTTNLWSMGQQFYVIRNMPAPGSAAEKAYNERQAAKAAHGGSLMNRITGVFGGSGGPPPGPDAEGGSAPAGGGPGSPNGTGPSANGQAGPPAPPARNQPKRQPKSKRQPKK